ncbi:unnamed protein product, partial [Medioppia subpectinata]
FTTTIFHPNVSQTGAICLDTLKRNWSAGLSIGKVLLTVQSLLADPNPNRIHKELTELQRDPPPGCTAAPNGDNYFQWTGSIEGPPDTPYEGGLFNVQINFPANYPLSAPQISFTTKYKVGLQHVSNNRLGLANDAYNGAAARMYLNNRQMYNKTAVSTLSLLADPNPNDAYNGAAARMYLNNRQMYNKTARHWTLQHAYPPPDYVFTTTQTTTTPANNQNSTGTGGSGSSG